MNKKALTQSATDAAALRAARRPTEQNGERSRLASCVTYSAHNAPRAAREREREKAPRSAAGARGSARFRSSAPASAARPGPRTVAPRSSRSVPSAQPRCVTLVLIFRTRGPPCRGAEKFARLGPRFLFSPPRPSVAVTSKWVISAQLEPQAHHCARHDAAPSFFFSRITSPRSGVTPFSTPRPRHSGFAFVAPLSRAAIFRPAPFHFVAALLAGACGSLPAGQTKKKTAGLNCPSLFRLVRCIVSNCKKKSKKKKNEGKWSHAINGTRSENKNGNKILFPWLRFFF